MKALTELQKIIDEIKSLTTSVNDTSFPRLTEIQASVSNNKADILSARLDEFLKWLDAKLSKDSFCRENFNDTLTENQLAFCLLFDDYQNLNIDEKLQKKIEFYIKNATTPISSFPKRILENFSLLSEYAMLKIAVDEYVSKLQELPKLISTLEELKLDKNNSTILGKIQEILEKLIPLSHLIKKIKSADIFDQDISRFDVLFKKVAKLNPTMQALYYQDKGVDKYWTYQELDEETDCLAKFLKSNGIEKCSRIGIFCQRSYYYPLLFLALAKLGATYVAYDNHKALQRTIEDIKDCKPLKLLVDEDNLKRLSGKISDSSIDIEDIDLFFRDFKKYKDQGKFVLKENEFSEKDKNPELYIMYSSGTTGKPKGIPIKHAGLIYWGKILRKELCEASSVRVLGNTTLGFDPHIWEYLMAWCSGGCLYFTNQETHDSIQELRDYIIAHNITDGTFSPKSFLHLLDDNNKTLDEVLAELKKSGLARCYLTGEALIPSIVSALLRAGIVIYNCFGPTELVFGYSIKRIEKTEEGRVEIGIITNSYIRTYIRELRQDKKGNWEKTEIIKPLKEICIAQGNFKGELLVYSPYMMERYLNNQEETNKNFINVPGESEKVYCTSDVIEYTKDKFYFSFRLSDLVKRNLVTINLEDIRTKLADKLKADAVEAMVEVVVVSRDDGKVDYLYLFTNEDINQDNQPAYLESFNNYILNNGLSYNEVADFVLPLGRKEFPLTANKKTDKAALEKKAKEHLREFLSKQTIKYKAKFDCVNKLHDIYKLKDELFDIVNKIIQEVTGRLDNEIMGDVMSSFEATEVRNNLSSIFNQQIAIAEYRRKTVKELQYSILRPYLLRAASNTYFRGCLGDKYDDSLIKSKKILFCLPPITGGGDDYYKALGNIEVAVSISIPTVNYTYKEIAIEAFANLTLKELAHSFSECIRLFQPNGPYHLLGWSFGGLLAIETSVKLGQTVFIGVVDSLGPNKQRELKDVVTLSDWLVHLCRSIRNQLSEKTSLDYSFLDKISFEDIRRKVSANTSLDFIAQYLNEIIREIESKKPGKKSAQGEANRCINLFRTIQMNLLAVDQWNPPNKIKSPIYLFQPENGFEGRVWCEREDWQQYASKLNVDFTPIKIENSHHCNVLDSDEFRMELTERFYSVAGKPQDIQDSMLSLELSKRIKEYYRDKKTIKTNFVDSFDLENDFIPVDISVKNELTDESQVATIENNDKPLEKYSDNSSQLIEFKDLFNDIDERPSKRIFLMGNSGNGNTVLCNYLSWSHDVLWPKKFSLVVSVSLKKIINYSENELTVENVIYNEYFRKNNSSFEVFSAELEKIHAGLKHIPKNKILYVLDDYDKVLGFLRENSNPSKAIFIRELLEKEYVFVTSCCYIDYAKMLPKWKPISFDLTLENRGFTAENRDKYIENISQKNGDNQIVRSRFKTILTNNAHIVELLSNPKYAEIICKKYQTNITMTVILLNLLKSVCFNLLSEKLPGLTEETIFDNRKCKVILNVLSFLAYTAIKNPDVEVDYEDLKSHVKNFFDKTQIDSDEIEIIDLIIQLGIVTIDKSNKTKNTYCCYFTKGTFGKFFLAYYFAERWQNLADVTLKEEFLSKRYNQDYEMVWWFIAGLLKNKKEALEDFFLWLEKEPRDLGIYYHQLLRLRCLNESEMKLKLLNVGKILCDISYHLGRWVSNPDENRVTEISNYLSISPYVFNSTIIIEKVKSILTSKNSVSQKNIMSVLKKQENLPEDVLLFLVSLIKKKEDIVEEVVSILNQTILPSSVLNKSMLLFLDENIGVNIKFHLRDVLFKRILPDEAFNLISKKLIGEIGVNNILQSQQCNLPISVLEQIVSLLTNKNNQTTIGVSSFLLNQLTLPPQILSRLISLVMREKIMNVLSLITYFESESNEAPPSLISDLLVFQIFYENKNKIALSMLSDFFGILDDGDDVEIITTLILFISFLSEPLEVALYKKLIHLAVKNNQNEFIKKYCTEIIGKAVDLFPEILKLLSDILDQKDTEKQRFALSIFETLDELPDFVIIRLVQLITIKNENQTTQNMIVQGDNFNKDELSDENEDENENENSDGFLDMVKEFAEEYDYAEKNDISKITSDIKDDGFNIIFKNFSINNSNDKKIITDIIKLLRHKLKLPFPLIARLVWNVLDGNEDNFIKDCSEKTLRCHNGLDEIVLMQLIDIMSDEEKERGVRESAATILACQSILPDRVLTKLFHLYVYSNEESYKKVAIKIINENSSMPQMARLQQLKNILLAQNCILTYYITIILQTQRNLPTVYLRDLFNSHKNFNYKKLGLASYGSYISSMKVIGAFKILKKQSSIKKELIDLMEDCFSKKIGEKEKLQGLKILYGNEPPLSLLKDYASILTSSFMNESYIDDLASQSQLPIEVLKILVEDLHKMTNAENVAKVLNSQAELPIEILFQLAYAITLSPLTQERHISSILKHHCKINYESKRKTNEFIFKRSSTIIDKLASIDDYYLLFKEEVEKALEKESLSNMVKIITQHQWHLKPELELNYVSILICKLLVENIPIYFTGQSFCIGAIGILEFPNVNHLNKFRIKIEEAIKHLSPHDNKESENKNEQKNEKIKKERSALKQASFAQLFPTVTPKLANEQKILEERIKENSSGCSIM